MGRELVLNVSLIGKRDMASRRLYVNDEANGSIYPEDLSDNATFVLVDADTGAGYLLEGEYDGAIPAGSYIVYLQD